jgi:hypothetical protein
MKRSLYFVNPWIDALLLGGASIFAFAVLRIWTDGARTETIYAVGAWLSWVCNWPHFSATNHRLYGSRSNIAQYPMTALLVPILVVCGMLFAFQSPTGFAPAFVKLFLLWSPYHFCGQTLGVSLLYARRAGIQISSIERHALSAFIFGTYFVQTFTIESGVGAHDYFGIQTPILGIPSFFVPIATVGMWTACAVFIGSALLRKVRGQTTLPWVLFLPAASHFVWFVLGRGWASFQEFVPFFHSLQYLLVAWAIQLKERAETTQRGGSYPFVARETLRFAGINIAGGAVLFHFLPQAASTISGTSIAFASGVVLAGVQIHHFFVDGVIWKLKRTTVSSPLMTDWDELARSSSPASELESADGLGEKSSRKAS